MAARLKHLAQPLGIPPQQLQQYANLSVNRERIEEAGPEYSVLPYRCQRGELHSSAIASRHACSGEGAVVMSAAGAHHQSPIDIQHFAVVNCDKVGSYS